MGYYIERYSSNEYQSVFPSDQADLSSIHESVSSALNYMESAGVRWESIEILGVSLVCPECEGKGYLFSVINDNNHIEIERCDSCCKFESDLSAMQAAIDLLGRSKS